MAQHFLLSAAARTLSLASVARMSDEEAERVFIRLRWARQRRQRLLPALRLHDGLHGPPPERCSALALQSLPQGFLGHERHAVRLPQDAAARPT